MPDYTKKADAVLEHCLGFTAREFAEVAMACLDQAGLSALDQDRVAAILHAGAPGVPMISWRNECACDHCSRPRLPSSRFCRTCFGADCSREATA